jgi:hypothetical protein
MQRREVLNTARNQQKNEYAVYVDRTATVFNEVERSGK